MDTAVDVNALVNIYYESNDFNMLREKTKKDYRYFINQIVKDIGDVKLEDVTPLVAKRLYEAWVKRGVSLANHICSVANLLFNYGVMMEYVATNPFSSVRRKNVPTRKTVWTREQLTKFLDVAYSEWEYRNIGLIAHMAYEWCQRVGDMRLLEWDSLDLENKKLSLTQSKRRSQVELPIHDDLASMLLEQQNLFGFQQYVVPMMEPVDTKYKPYTIYHISRAAKAILTKAGLPDELRLSDLRRTGTTEMVDAGVSMAQIMSVTGHSNPQSVKPYMKHTYISANAALAARKASKDHDTS